MRRESFGVVVGAIVVVAVVVIGLVISIVYATSRSEMAGCVVKDKEAVRSNDSNEYRVYTENCGTLKVGDSVFIMRFDSADVYADIDAGQAYDFKLQGFRIPVLSMFPNVIEATPV